MNSKPTARYSVYTRRLFTKLLFLRDITAKISIQSVIMLSAGLLRAKIINLFCDFFERILSHRVKCPCCGWSGLRFRTIFFGAYLRDNCGCPRCKSMERHRAYFLFYQSKITKDHTVLYIAPERSLQNLLGQQAGKVITVDLFAPGVDVRTNIMHLPFQSESVDIIINHHVLEHVVDDFSALGEFERVLKPGGRMFCSVPINETLPITVEWGFPDPSKQDHYREYGIDFFQRLDKFVAKAVDISVIVPRDLVYRYGLSESEVLYAAHRRPSVQPN